MEVTTLLGNKFHKHADDNLETFRLVCLGAEISTSEEYRDTRQKLRAIINHLEIFEDGSKCQEYIRSVPKGNRLVLIVGDRFGQEVVSPIHKLQQVSSIYVHNLDETKYKQWNKDFPKVKVITSGLDKVISQIKSDQNVRVKIEEPLSIKLFNPSIDANLPMTEFDQSGIHFQMLIHVLLRIRSNEKDRKELISLCKKEYKGNKEQLALIRDFEQNYSASKALQWYICDSFLQKILNKALRVQNIHVIYLFRSFIRQIHQQLQRHQCQSSIRAYKGQMMSTDELNSLKHSIGKLISVNSFLLASDDCELVLSNLDQTTSSNNMKRVLFDIEADPRIGITKPFAKLSSLGHSANKAEILFTIGSIFRITDIRRDNNRRWVIRMTLCSNDERDLKQTSEYIVNEYGRGEANLLSLGTVLRDMGEYDLAEKYFSRMLTELRPNDPLVGALYPSLGLVAKDKSDYDKSLKWYHKALEIYMRTRPSDYMAIGDTFNTIGMIYHENKGDCNRALSYYNEAISLFKRVHVEMHPMMAIFYNNIGAVYEEQKNYREALISYKKSLSIKKQYLPDDHPDIGRAYGSIAAAHGYLKSYDIALENYKKALKIQLKSLPLQHPDIALTYANMGSIYASKTRLQQALTYWYKASAIFRDTLLPQHPLVLKIDEEIRRTSSKLSYYSHTKKIGKNRITPV